MNSLFSHEIIFSSLKNILKKKNITYKKLSRLLRISEPGVKKIFQTKKMSIERLCEICELLDITLSEFFQYAEQNKDKEFLFTEEQENFFVSHPKHYLFFREIFFEKKSLDQLKKQFLLSETSILKYLSGLEKIGLLELHPGLRIRFKVYGRLRWRDRGPWMKHNYATFSKKLTEAVTQQLNHTSGNQNQVFFGYFTLSKANLSGFLNEIEALDRRYRNLAFEETFSVDKNRQLPVTWNFQIATQEIIQPEVSLHQGERDS